MASSTTVGLVNNSSFIEYHSFANDNACIFSLLSSVFVAVFHASFVIAFNPTRHFSYSSGSRSSMYLLMFSFACCLKIDKSLFTVPILAWSILAISG
jgi:hypothetical protein